MPSKSFKWLFFAISTSSTSHSFLPHIYTQLPVTSCLYNNRWLRVFEHSCAARNKWNFIGNFFFPLVKLHTRLSRIYLFESVVNITPDDHAVSSKFENYLYINALKLSITRCARGRLLLTKTWWVNRAYFGLPSHDFHFCLDFSWHHCQILI